MTPGPRLSGILARYARGACTSLNGVGFGFSALDAQGAFHELHRYGDAMAIDPATWRIVYRGRINDRVNFEAQKQAPTRNDLADALHDVLARRRSVGGARRDSAG